MKNKEKYLEEILDAFASSEECVLKQELGIAMCTCNVSCNKCKAKTLEWLEQEYIEPIKLTYFEKVILDNIDNRAKWLARDRYGDIYAYDVKPCKDGMLWENGSTEFDLNIFKHLFNFVKWEDEEPCNIQELLENCDVV